MKLFINHFKDNLPIEEFHAIDENPLIQTTICLEKAIKGKEDSTLALEQAQELKVKETDPNLLCLFLCTWAKLSWQLNRINEGKTLLQRAKSIISKEVIPEVICYILSIEGLISSKEGDKQKREELGQKILDTLPLTSPKRKMECLNHLYFLAQLGKLHHLQHEIQWLKTQIDDRFPDELVDLLIFTDAISTGRTNIAHSKEKKLIDNNAFLEKYPFAKKNFYNQIYILQLMEGNWTQNEDYLPKKSDLNNYAQTLRALLARCPTDALKFAKSYSSEYNMKETAINSIGIESYNLLRAELSTSNWQAAKRILELRHTRGNRHYLDDFFWARVKLLEGKNNEASNYFNMARIEAEKHNALGRLDFEMSLSCEMKPGQKFKLIDQSKNSSKNENKFNQPLMTKPYLGVSRLIGESNIAKQLNSTIIQFSALEIPVLITGETGTGKEIVAKALHEEGPRCKEPFIAVNCGAIGNSILESELFGHQKGAFTGAIENHKGYFETAGKGTLLLDEIGEISPRLQVSLLRVLENQEIIPIGSSLPRKVNCRILFATNANLDILVQEGKFRKDLYFRLRRLQIQLSPLRERRDDIIPMADHFLNQGRPEYEHAQMSPSLIQYLLSHQWPGNIRELNNTIETMRLISSEKLTYEMEDIPFMKESQISKPQIKQNAPPIINIDQPYGNSHIRKEMNIIALFKEHKILTRKEIADFLNLTPKTVTQYLKKLCENKIIKKIEPSKSPKSHYFKWTE